MQTEQANTILDYGELAIGLGTFILGVTVAIATGYNSWKDRRVHIADKRMEWINEFRNTISEIISVSLSYGPGVGDVERLEKLKERYNFLKHKLELLGLWENDFVYDEESIFYDLGNLDRQINNQAILGDGGISSVRRNIMNKSRKIIDDKWQKIKKLRK